MENVIAELKNLGIFLFEFSLVYVPCVIGTLCGIHFNKGKANTKPKKKRTVGKTVLFALSSSIMPTLIIMIGEFLLPNETEVNFILEYAIAMILGFIGADKVTEYFMNVYNILKVMKSISEGMPGLTKLSEEMEKEKEENEEDG